MSCGYWNFRDSDLKTELFGWDHYDLKKIPNVMEDQELSELLYDILCVVHECDRYFSGDSDKPDYLKAKKDFKEKWLEVDSKTRVKRQVDKSIEDLREELYNMFGVTDNKESNND